MMHDNDRHMDDARPILKGNYGNAQKDIYTYASVGYGTKWMIFRISLVFVISTVVSFLLLSRTGLGIWAVAVIAVVGGGMLGLFFSELIEKLAKKRQRARIFRKYSNN